MAEEFRVFRPYEFHTQLIKKGTRADGRKLKEFRELKLETDAITTANSSSLVKLGNTSLVCGCTVQLLKMQPGDRLQEETGGLNIKVELPPICSSPTGYQTQHTAQLVTKTLRNILDDTECLDLDCLYHKEKKCYWSVDVEVICLNYDGSLLDASIIAVMTALQKLRLKDETNQILEKVFSIKSIPVCSSFALIGDDHICDPNLEEETVAESTFSVTVTSEGSTQRYHINKIGGKSIDAKLLQECIAIARERATEVRKLLGIADTEIHATMDCT